MKKQVWFQRLMNGWEIGFFGWTLSYNEYGRNKRNRDF